jgi:serine phosphatase RsbU (regulator of sigma subunit)
VAGAERTKECLDTFASRPDPCLGESLETVYKEHDDELRQGDALVLFTDGIVEGQNLEGEEFGERRLSRGVMKAADLGAAALKDAIVGQAQAFCTKPVQDDDITLVVVKRHAAVASTRLAG